MLLQLTKQSTDSEIKAYFEEVWPLVYSAKEKAVRALKSNDLFLQNVDYQVLAQNGENSGVLAQNGGKVPNGRPTETYMLSVPCDLIPADARFSAVHAALTPSTAAPLPAWCAAIAPITRNLIYYCVAVCLRNSPSKQEKRRKTLFSTKKCVFFLGSSEKSTYLCSIKKEKK